MVAPLSPFSFRARAKGQGWLGHEIRRENIREISCPQQHPCVPSSLPLFLGRERREERQGRETPKHKPDHRKGKKGIMVWHWARFSLSLVSLPSPRAREGETRRDRERDGPPMSRSFGIACLLVAHSSLSVGVCLPSLRAREEEEKGMMGEIT